MPESIEQLVEISGFTLLYTVDPGLRRDDGEVR